MVTSIVLSELESLRRKWGWLLALGIGMVILGVIALIMMPAATIGTVLVLGWLMVVSGIIEFIHAFRVRGWRGTFLHVVAGILGALLGLLVVSHPVAGALALTLLFAAFFTVIGLFRIFAEISLKHPNWGWGVFDGIITLALGVLLWVGWPRTGLWYLGLAVGVSLILRGWSYVMFAIAIRSLRPPSEIRQAA